MTERLWFKIGETATRLGVSPKDLRYWESLIPELKPRRSQGNLRYYHVDEFPRLERIRDWLRQGFTVADCRELLRHGQLSRGLDLGLEEPTEPPAPPTRRSAKPTLEAPPRRDLTPVIRALQGLLRRLSRPLTRPHAPKPLLDLDP